VVIARTYPAENMAARREVARAMFGPLEFNPEEQAELPCPAAHLHGKQDNRQARLYLSGPPTLFCFHASCVVELETLNTRLRQEIAKAERGTPAGGTAMYREVLPRNTERKKAEARCKAMGPAVREQAVRLFPLELPDLWELSPHRLEANPSEHFAPFMRTLWQPHEIVWCGYNWESGKEGHRDNFKPAAVWADLGRPPGPQTSAFAFKPGSFSRKASNLDSRRHLVCESDTLTKEHAASVFLWLRERMHLRLRAVVHSGNKSLHGWFAVPGDDQLKELNEVLPHAGMDAKVLKTSGIPVRVPGWKREETGEWQRLLYLDPAACEL
jgi:hypothetical protein